MGAHSSPFFFLTANTNSLMIACRYCLYSTYRNFPKNSDHKRRFIFDVLVLSLFWKCITSSSFTKITKYQVSEQGRISPREQSWRRCFLWPLGFRWNTPVHMITNVIFQIFSCTCKYRRINLFKKARLDCYDQYLPSLRINYICTPSMTKIWKNAYHSCIRQDENLLCPV